MKAGELAGELPQWWGDPDLLVMPRRLGADLAEIFAESWVRTSQGSDGRGGWCSDVLAEAGLGVRLVRGDAVAYGFSSELALAGLHQAMDQAAAALAARAGISSPGTARAWGRVGRERRPLIPEPATPRAVKADYVRQCVLDVGQAHGAGLKMTGYLEEESRILAVMNSAGASGLERSSRSRIWITARMVGNGKEKEVILSPGQRIPAGELIESAGSGVAAEAAARATVLGTAALVRPGQYDVVLAPAAAGFFVHETCGHACEADALSRDSALGARFGQQVAPPELCVIDDPSDLAAWGSFSLDDEGTPARAVTLIDEGVLTGMLSCSLPDPASRWIGQLPQPAGGRGRRASYQHAPLARLSHTQVLPGRVEPQDAIASVSHGLHVTEIAAGRFTPRDGLIWLDIAEARMIRDGCLAEHVTGGRISIDVRQALGTIGAVCSDPRSRAATCLKRGQQVPVSVVAPTLLLPAVTVLAHG